MPDFQEERVSIPKEGWLRLNLHHSEYGTYATGDFVDQRGTVTIYQQDPDAGFKKGYTRLDSIVDGKLVYRSWEKKLGRRTIYREARELLETQ